MSSKAGGCDDDGGVLWDPAVCVLEQSVSFRLSGRLEDGRRAAPKGVLLVGSDTSDD